MTSVGLHFDEPDYTYEEVKYQEDLSLVTGIRRSDGWDIPLDENNSMYQKYLEWVAAGNTPGELIRE